MNKTLTPQQSTDLQCEARSLAVQMQNITEYLGIPNGTDEGQLSTLVINHIKALELRYLPVETSLKSAIPVISVTVKRDGRGLWRHPRYPAFGVGDVATALYSEWCKANAITVTATYLVAPDNVDITSNDYSDWKIVKPSGEWFLLAIEEFTNGPVCIWGWRKA